MSARLPHVDGSGRGLEDGECVHCGASGSLEHEECPARLREHLDAWEAAGARMSGVIVTTRLHPVRPDPVYGSAIYNVAKELTEIGIDVDAETRAAAIALGGGA